MTAIKWDERVALLDSRQPPDTVLGERGQIRFFRDGHGNQVASYFWPAEGEAKAVCLLLHGHGSYIQFDFLRMQAPGQPKTYAGSWIEVLNKQGYSVTGVDLPGQGRSEGLFGYCPTFDHYVDPIVQHASALQGTDLSGFAGKPVFLLGCSLGGCIAVHAALKQPQLFRGVALLAPMLSLDKVAKQGANPYLRPFGFLLNALVPTAPLSKTSPNTMFPHIQEDWEADPCTYHYSTRVRNAWEYLRVCLALMRNLSAVTFPFLIIHSSKDTMTDPDGSRAFYEGAASADKSLQVVHNMWHVLHREDGNLDILREVVDWMERRVGDGA